MRQIFLTLLFIAFIPHLLFAQEDDSWFLEKPITSIQFEGLGSVSENELFGLIRPYLGEPYTEERSWEIQGKLYALDYFDLIVPKVLPGPSGKDSVELIFQVKEKPQVKRVLFSGNTKVGRTLLTDTVLIKSGDLLNTGSLKADEQLIVDLYLEKGFVDARVESQYAINEEDNQATVTFNIEEGNQTKISEIRFVGNDQFVTDGILRKIMSTKPVSLFQKGSYVESKLQEDIKTIERYYGDQGLVDASVVDVDRQIVYDKEEKVNKMIITIVLNEGERWKFGSINIQGNKVYTDEELRDAITQKTGDTFNLTAFQQDYQRIRDLYAENGYILNSFSLEEKRDEENKEISYTITIVERDRGHVARILVQGNTTTKDYVILREIPIDEGEVFSRAKFVEGLRNLTLLQYFQAVDIRPYPSETYNELIDLVVNVEEGKTTNFGFGIGLSGDATTFPISGQLTWSEKNFLGRGQNIGARLSVSPDTQNISLSFSDPYLFGKRINAGFELSYAHRIRRFIAQDLSGIGVPYPYETWEEYKAAKNRIPTDAQMKYNSHVFSVGPNVGYTWVSILGRFGISTGFRVSLEGVYYDQSVYTPQNSILRNNQGKILYNDQISLRLSWDTRDLRVGASRGFLLSNTFTWAGVLEKVSTRNYLKNVLSFDLSQKIFEIPIGKKGGTFSSTFQLKSAFNSIWNKPWRKNDGNVAEINGFFINGIFTARGWPSSQGSYYKYLWDNTIQIKFPLVPNLMAFDIFLDAVGAWIDDTEFNSWNGNQWRFSLGAGFRFDNPQFPIGIYLVKRFQWKNNVFTWFPDDKPVQYEFRGAGLDLVISFDLSIY